MVRPMNNRSYNSASDNALNLIRGHGGSYTIDFRTDDVTSHLVRTLNHLADTGRVTKSTHTSGLVHTFTLREAKTTS